MPDVDVAVFRADCRSRLILDQIAEQEKIEVPEDELEHDLEELAKQSKQTLEQVRTRLTENGGLDRIRHRLRNEKTLDTLYRRSA